MDAEKVILISNMDTSMCAKNDKVNGWMNQKIYFLVTGLLAGWLSDWLTDEVSDWQSDWSCTDRLCYYKNKWIMGGNMNEWTDQYIFGNEKVDKWKGFIYMISYFYQK